MIVTTIFMLIPFLGIAYASKGEFLFFLFPVILAIHVFKTFYISLFFTLIDIYIHKKLNINRSWLTLSISNIVASTLSLLWIKFCFILLHEQKFLSTELSINFLVIIFFIVFGLIKYDMLKTLTKNSIFLRKIIFWQMFTAWITILILLYSSQYTFSKTIYAIKLLLSTNS